MAPLTEERMAMAVGRLGPIGKLLAPWSHDEQCDRPEFTEALRRYFEVVLRG